MTAEEKEANRIAKSKRDFDILSGCAKIESALMVIFGDAYQGEWWKNKEDKWHGNFYPKIANCYYRIKIFGKNDVEAYGNGKHRPPTVFVKLVHSELRKYLENNP